MAREGWTSAFVRRTTLAALKAYREDCEELRELGLEVLRANAAPGGGLPSIDAVICRLLELVHAHRERAAAQRWRRKTSAKRSARRAAEETAPAAPEAPPARVPRDADGGDVIEVVDNILKYDHDADSKASASRE